MLSHCIVSQERASTAATSLRYSCAFSCLGFIQGVRVYGLGRYYCDLTAIHEYSSSTSSQRAPWVPLQYPMNTNKLLLHLLLPPPAPSPPNDQSLGTPMFLDRCHAYLCIFTYMYTLHRVQTERMLTWKWINVRLSMVAPARILSTL